MHWTVVCCLLCASIGAAQISKPIATNDAIDVENNKFLRRRPDLDERGKSNEDDEEIITSLKRCPIDMHLRWMTQVSSSVYATPIIVDLFSDNKKEILVPSHVHYLEALEAEDGAAAVGWPAFHKSHLDGSPFLFDIDRDNVLDIGIGTYNGEIQFYKDTGEKMVHSMSVPPLRVKKRWYVGLNSDPVDHSHMDIGNAKAKEETKDSAKDDVQITRRRLLAEEATVEGNGQKLTDAAADSFKVFDETANGDEDDEEYEDYGAGVYTVDHNSRFRGGDGDGIYDYEDMSDDDSNYDLDRKVYGNEDEWDDEFTTHYEDHGDSEYVYLDAHILSTPIVADLDGDGNPELIVAVSYFFDDDFYSRNGRHLLPKDVQIDKYLAGGIVVFDLTRRYVRWSTHLDMTTKEASVDYKAFMTASPAVLDIDRDGKMEIVVGNQVGFLYVLDSNGNAREGWPKQMGYISARPLVGDWNDDGNIEIVAVDDLGNVAMFDIHGKEIWERHFQSAVASTPTAGDITGNGELDFAFGTLSGHLYVVDAKTGQDRSPFPFRVHGDIRSPITVTKLKESPGQQLVFMAFDGFLYVVDGETACVDARDIGEDSYSMVLVDDVTDDGGMDLIVTTMNGNILVFETGADYHPLRTWTAEIRGTESPVAREGHVGIFASKESRASRDIRGDRFVVRFSIVDERAKGKSTFGPYNVTVVLKNAGWNELNMGSSPVIGVMDTYAQPGTYEVSLPCPKSRTTALLQLTMTDSSRQEFVDQFSLSFHMHWYKFIKWLIAIPFTAMAMVAVYIRPSLINGLPA